MKETVVEEIITFGGSNSEFSFFKVFLKIEVTTGHVGKDQLLCL